MSAGGDEPLFGGDDALFRELAAVAKVYGEYGCGASTRWMLAATAARVLAVDSDRDWVAEIARSAVGVAGAEARLALKWVDLGPLGPWGQPLGYSRRSNFRAYTDWIWNRDAAPDLVLIDGRFRVCCFLTTLKRAVPGTRVLFDDYCERPHYHIVEEFLPRTETCGRQALFVVPPDPVLAPSELNGLINRFRMVRD